MQSKKIEKKNQNKGSSSIVPTGDTLSKIDYFIDKYTNKSYKDIEEELKIFKSNSL